MMKKLACCEALPQYMLTLTYPREFPAVAEAKGHLKTFCQRLERAFEVGGKPLATLWRLEFQQRGAVHFHLLLFAPKGVPQATLMEAAGRGKRGSARDFTEGRRTAPWLDGGAKGMWGALLVFASVTWHDVIRKAYAESVRDEEWFRSHLKNGTDVKPIRNAAMAISYVSKYLAKVPGETSHVDLPKSTGRFWGVRDKAGLLKPKLLEEAEASEWPVVERMLEALLARSEQRYFSACVRDGRLAFFAFERRDETPKQASLLAMLNVEQLVESAETVAGKAYSDVRARPCERVCEDKPALGTRGE